MVGDAGVYLPPMGLMRLIGRMGCGDAVGADEIDGAVEVEVVAGEEEVAEFVVSIECTGEDIRSTDRHRFTSMWLCQARMIKKSSFLIEC